MTATVEPAESGPPRSRPGQRLLSLQFARFIVVGVLNTAFSYSVYAAMLFVGLTYTLANLVALLVGVLFSFRTQGRWVFHNRDDRLLVRFAACWGLVWLINIGLISVLVRGGLNAYGAGALALVPVTVVSYFLQKLLVFSASGSNLPARPAK